MEFRLSRSNPYLTLGLPLAAPLAMVILGEAFLYFGNLEASILVHLLNILMCVMMPILLKENPMMWQAFSLVSMLRVLNLGLPTFATLTIYWLPLVYAPVIIVAFLVIRDESLGWRDYVEKARKLYDTKLRPSGWKLWYLPLGIILSLVMANVEFAVLSRSVDDLRMVPDLSFGSLAALFLVMVFFVGLGEELVFRYILQSRLEGVLGTLMAIFLASIVFAVMHSGYQSFPYLCYVFLVSFLLGSLFYKTRSLALVTLIHGCLNFFLFSFLPYGHLLLF